MQTLVLALLLAAVLAFFLPTVQNRVRDALHARPAAIWAVPFLLIAVFSGAAALAGAFSVSLALLVLGYTAAPVVCAWVGGAGFIERPALARLRGHSAALAAARIRRRRQPGSAPGAGIPAQRGVWHRHSPGPGAVYRIPIISRDEIQPAAAGVRFRAAPGGFRHHGAGVDGGRDRPRVHSPAALARGRGDRRPRWPERLG